MNLQELGCGMDWSDLTHERWRWRGFCKWGNEILDSCGEFLTTFEPAKFSRRPHEVREDSTVRYCKKIR